MVGEILRVRDVLLRTGLSRSTIWRLVRKGEFPAPLILSANAIGWASQEVEAWLGSRQRRTYGGNAAETVKGVP